MVSARWNRPSSVRLRLGLGSAHGFGHSFRLVSCWPLIAQRGSGGLIDPFKVEIAGSNPAGVTILVLTSSLKATRAGGSPSKCSSTDLGVR
jgi:hypothetical protein